MIFCCQTKKCRSLVVLSLIFLVGSLLFATQVKNPVSQKSQNKLFIKDSEFLVEIADNPESRTRGLSGRESLNQDEFMLFVFDEPDFYGFWMKDMNFPIDIVWLDENFVITHIEENVSPESFPKSFVPEEPSQYVLEFKAGMSSQLDLAKSDIIEISKVLQ